MHNQCTTTQKLLKQNRYDIQIITYHFICNPMCLNNSYLHRFKTNGIVITLKQLSVYTYYVTE